MASALPSDAELDALAPAAVAASVFLLNVLVKVGIEAVCEGCQEQSDERGKP